MCGNHVPLGVGVRGEMCRVPSDVGVGRKWPSVICQQDVQGYGQMDRGHRELGRGGEHTHVDGPEEGRGTGILSLRGRVGVEGGPPSKR